MSTTKNLGLFKHDNPETNTEKFDIDNYLNGNWDKIDENVGEVNTNISNINSKNTELEKELKEAQEDFYQNSIRGQASGEYIHVEDSSNCRAKIGIGGNSEQETREGYNLLNFKKWKDNNVSWNLGKNIVYGDNYVSGTSEGTDCYSNTVNEQYRFNCEPNTTYTLFYINDNSIMCRPIAFVYDSESKNIQTLELGLSADNIIIKRFTTSSEAGKMAIRLGTNVDGVNFKFSNIMILKGIYDKSTIPNYEQYGAMPSPDYPSEIKTVGSNGCVKVTKCNKNIWNLGNKGNNSGDISFPLKSGKYTLSFKKKRISNSTITNAWVYRYAYIRFYDKNDTLLSSIKDGMAINLTANQTSDRQIIDFTAPENTVKMIVNFSNNNGDNNNNTEAIEIQLEGEKATSFEQHEEQSYIMPVQKEMLEGDYFDWDNEEEVHVWGNVIVNGTETINKNSNSEFFSITKSMSQFDTSANVIKQSISNYGTGTTLALGSGNTNNKYSFNASTIYLDCYNSNINTVEKLKVQLTKNNMKIYAKLATPTRLKFTDEQKAVAKELNNARTYKNVTNITTDSKAILSLDYAKDLETLLNNTQALAVNNASEGV